MATAGLCGLATGTNCLATGTVIGTMPPCWRVCMVGDGFGDGTTFGGAGGGGCGLTTGFFGL